MAARKPEPKVGGSAHPPVGPDENGDGGSYERDAIEKGRATKPLRAAAQQPATAAADEFVRLPNGVLVQYKAGDRLDPAHVGLPTVPGVLDAHGVLQPQV